MQYHINKKIIILFLSIFVFCVYLFFLVDFNSNQPFEKDVQVQQLNTKIDEISNALTENHSFLNKLQLHFKNIVQNEENSVTDLPPSVHKVHHKKEELPLSTVVTPVVVFVYNRPSVTRCLDLLLKYRDSDGMTLQFPIVVSQDGNHLETTKAVESYGHKINHIRHPSENLNIPSNHRNFAGYYKISSHYKWAITQVFEQYPSAKALIIVEDDLEIAPDFFQYFYYSQSLLLRDESLYCVSAWNDNGKENTIEEGATTTLYRSDFFPGLGWMLKRSLWDEIGPHWPPSFWDDWFRQPSQRRDRACIRPEISRTRTFGRIGVSNGQFYDQYLKFIKLNDQSVNWKQFDFTKLEKSTYDKDFLSKVRALPQVSLSSVQDGKSAPAVRLVYRSASSFKSYARTLGIMDDFKSGVPRTGYRGIVSIYYNDVRIYLTPEEPWKGYNENWS